MTNFYCKPFARAAGGRWATAGLFLWAWLLAAVAAAQAPAWALATAGVSRFGTYYERARAVATDANGNVFVAGTFTNSIIFGNKTLSSAGGIDYFIAKYVPSTNTWAWAQRGGGTDDDYAYGLAVRGSSVYLTGTLTNTFSNSNAVTLSSAGTGITTVQVPVRGASPTASRDILVAKYTDNGLTATLNWAQVDGGTDNDVGQGIAVSGANVYVTGYVVNNLLNTYQVAFGSTATAPGTATQLGTAAGVHTDLVVAKYLDGGTSATYQWSQVGGGLGGDGGFGIAVSGSSVYVAGYLVNDIANAAAVKFGGSGTTLGTTVQYGASNQLNTDWLVAKYTDNGPTATLGWTQVGGGNQNDFANAIAANGSNVYVTGSTYGRIGNVSQVVFGGTGTTLATIEQDGASYTNGDDIVLAKYTDNGTSATFGWSQVGGGSEWDQGYGVAVNGPNVYVTGLLRNNAANTSSALFGGAGILQGTVPVAGVSPTVGPDVVVAKYTDNGPTATLGWTRVGGGNDDDYGTALAVGPAGLYVVGRVAAAATFGSLSLSTPAGDVGCLLAGFAVPVLAAAPALVAAAPQLFPNPASGPATLSGAPAGASVHVRDALGRCVATTTARADGTAPLPGGLPTGLYLVQAGAATLRWAVK